MEYLNQVIINELKEAIASAPQSLDWLTQLNAISEKVIVIFQKNGIKYARAGAAQYLHVLEIKPMIRCGILEAMRIIEEDDYDYGLVAGSRLRRGVGCLMM